MLDALTKAIFEASMVSGEDGRKVLVLRTAEIVQALTTCTASMLALSPSTARDRRAIKALVKQFEKPLRGRVAAIDPIFRDFKSRCFHDDDDERGGHS
jgi:hypothetical protein